MDESTITFALKNISLNNNYLGIFTKIDLEKLNINTYKNFSLILFIDNISENLGHWTCIIKIDNKIFFLDSFGFDSKFYHLNFKKIFKSKNRISYFFLKFRLQGNNTTTCGAYVIYFIKNIVDCNYYINCFKNIFLQDFTENSLKKMINLLHNIYIKILNIYIQIYVNLYFVIQNLL